MQDCIYYYFIIYHIYFYHTISTEWTQAGSKYKRQKNIKSIIHFNEFITVHACNPRLMTNCSEIIQNYNSAEGRDLRPLPEVMAAAALPWSPKKKLALGNLPTLMTDHRDAAVDHPSIIPFPPHLTLLDPSSSPLMSPQHGHITFSLIILWKTTIPVNGLPTWKLCSIVPEAGKVLGVAAQNCGCFKMAPIQEKNMLPLYSIDKLRGRSPDSFWNNICQTAQNGARFWDSTTLSTWQGYVVEQLFFERYLWKK